MPSMHEHGIMREDFGSILLVSRAEVMIHAVGLGACLYVRFV